MSDKPASAPPGPAHASQRTAQEVIDMFAEVGLSVTDDNAAIQQRVKDQYPRRLRQKNSTNPSERHTAEKWFKNVEAMQNRRTELLRVAYEHFEGLARVALSAAAASGVATMTPELRKNLLEIAFRQCRIDDNLAAAFLSDFMLKEGISEGGVFVRPAAIENLTATSDMGKIMLEWSLPSANCDEVEIIREEESASKKPAGKTIYRGCDTSFVDGGLAPGRWYRYRAHSVYQDFDGADTVTRAVCLGEVTKAKAEWINGRIVVRWEPPGPDAAVVVFRREGGAPSLRRNSRGIEPADDSSIRLWSGAGDSFEDPQVIEGVTYHYRIIADFGGDLFTKGTDVQARVPVPPPAVPSLSGHYRYSDGKDTAVLEWEAVQGGIPVDYVLVRREGSAPPARVEEGTIVQTTSQYRCLDDQVESGRRYTYAVFSRLGDLYSRTGTASPPIDILADVRNLAVKSGDGTVELQWTTPLNASDVVVRRGLEPPRDHTDGARVNRTGEGNAKDDGLRNGQPYHYLVCCVYRPDGTTEAFSCGARISAVPDRLPEAISDFAGRAEGGEIICTWSPPDYGLAVVIRSAAPHAFPYGHRLSSDEIDSLGERIVTFESGRAVDANPEPSKPHYSIFTVAGGQAIAGGTGAWVACPDVADLILSATREGIVLRWTWPRDCKAVRIARRVDAWPEGPDDPRAAITAVSQIEYAAAANRFVDKIEQKSARFYYVVYAQASGAPGRFFAPGTSPGCRDVIQWEPWMTLHYKLATPEKDSHRGKEIQLNWSVEKPFQNFSGFALVAGQASLPSSIDEGVELFRWTPDKGVPQGTQETFVSLAPIQQRRWARFFCKAMVVDPAQRHTTLIVHPNTCVPISETGELELPKRTGKVRTYSHGVPKEVICPNCFQKFPVSEIRFASFSGGDEPVAGRYSMFDKLLKRPPQPPTNAQGQRLARKICPNPNCKRDLPFTAGAQESLVIGMIGAKYSGKSHYVASLIKRLQEQVCNDLQAALIPMSDETRDRYQREFHDPLFLNRFELPATAGTPPPLIYDLTLSGKLFGEERNRAITLALYDTAGENFDKADTVRQMVEYLRVASGIIFLIDPLQVTAVRESLPASVRLPEADRSAGPHEIISRVLSELENGRVLTESDAMPTPVAVALTKCDVLRDASLIEANRLWNTDARHIGYFDTATSDDLTGMMGEYIQRWSPAVYNIVRQRFSNHAFFGLSATGCAADKETGRYKYISPWRVEDPLLWLLAQLGVIPTR